MTKYERINRAKLTDKGKAVYDKLSKATDGFKNKEAVKKNKAVLDKFYDRVKAGLPEAIKPAKSTKPKAKSKSKAKAKPKKPAYKNVNMGSFAKETSALAKKEGISYREAQKKMSAIYKQRKVDAQKKQGTDFDKMIAGLKKKVSYKGGRGLTKTTLKKDAKLDALKFGKRISKGTGANQYGKAKKGSTYYEYRDNRADVKSAPPSQPYPKLESGGKIREAGDVDFPEKLLGYAKGGDVELKEISTPQLYSILKLKFTQSIQTNTDYKVGNDVYYIRDGYYSKDLDDDKLYLYKKTKGGNELIGVLKTIYAKGGMTKEIENDFNMPKFLKDQIIDKDGKRKIDDKSIEMLTDYTNNVMPQTKDVYFKDGKYTKERQKLHKEIIDDFKGNLVCIQQDEPIAILMGGSPASGKSTFLRKYAPYLLEDEILRIDADEVRSQLPEYDGWNASATHLETKDIVNTLLSDRTIGLPCEYDVIYDGTMNNTKAYLPLIKLLKKLGYKIYVVYIDNVPKPVIERRIMERYQKSGRFVPLEVVDDFFSKGKTALNEIKKKVDGYMIVDGSDSNYTILEEGGMKLPKSRKYSQIGTAIDKMATGGEVFSKEIARGYDVNLKSGTGTYAKGGKIEYYKDGEPILDTMEKEKMLKPLDDYGYYLKIGNVIHYYDDNKNWETSKLGFAKGGKLSEKVKSIRDEFVDINNKVRGVKYDLEQASYKDDKAYNLSRWAGDAVYTGTQYQNKLNKLRDDMIDKGYAKGGSLNIQGINLKKGDKFKVGDDSSIYTFVRVVKNDRYGFNELEAENEFDNKNSFFRIDTMEDNGLYITKVYDYAKGGVVTFKLRNNDGRYNEVWELDEREMETYDYKDLKDVSDKRLIEDYFGDVYRKEGDDVFIDDDVIVESIDVRKSFAKGGKTLSDRDFIDIYNNVVDDNEAYPNDFGNVVDSINYELNKRGFEENDIETNMLRADLLDRYDSKVLDNKGFKYAKGGLADEYDIDEYRDLRDRLVDLGQEDFVEYEESQQNNLTSLIATYQEKLTDMGYAKGGKTKKMKKDDNWIQKVDEEMERKGTKGAFTKQAENAGMSTVAFAKDVLSNPDKYSEKTRERAQFMKNVNPELFEYGGKITECGDVDFPEKLLGYAKGGKLNNIDDVDDLTSEIMLDIEYDVNIRPSEFDKIKDIVESNLIKFYNKGGNVDSFSHEIARGYDVNLKSGTGTYAKGGRTTQDTLRKAKGKTIKEIKFETNYKDDNDTIVRIILEDDSQFAFYSSKEMTGVYAPLNQLWQNLSPMKSKDFAKGGKTQGYNARLDESLAMRDGSRKTKRQTYKGRRDESKGEEKALGKRAYSSVDTMDDAMLDLENFYAKGGEIEVGDWVQHKKGDAYGRGQVYKIDGLGVYLKDKYGNESHKAYQVRNLKHKGKPRYAKGGSIAELEAEIKRIGRTNPGKAGIMSARLDDIKREQGYNARLDESLAMRRGKAKSKKQTYKGRRDESKGENKAKGKRAYSSVKTMDKKVKYRGRKK